MPKISKFIPMQKMLKHHKKTKTKLWKYLSGHHSLHIRDYVCEIKKELVKRDIEI